MSPKAVFAVAGMAIAVSVTYLPAPPARMSRGAEWTLGGLDYSTLHTRRLRYAQEALFGPDPHLPGWYTRELGGSPFWSNLHNFPLIPTRLPLLVMDPDLAFSAGVQMAAFLTALFTYLYCRRLGLGCLASAVGGWTFACSGFFAARVLAGHLPLLEAYPALPLLLWLVEVNVQAPAGDRRCPWKLVAVAGASCAIALAGHPQVPAYSFAAAGLYALWRGRGRRGMMLAAAMVLGIGAAGFALYPMLLLVQRSTRILALAAADNDVALPYSRLPAFILPWRDGWPLVVGKTPPRAFAGYPNVTYFWDTVGYVGLLPLAAAGALATRAIVRRERPRGPWLFLAALGIAALILAFPPWHAVMRWIPGTLLRSPARQIYLTTFALAMAMAAAVDLGMAWVRFRRQRWPAAALAAALALHAWDLGYLHDRPFVVGTLPPSGTEGEEEAIGGKAGQQRIAIDLLMKPYTRGIDDVGFFDSVILAKPYRALMEVGGAVRNLNLEVVQGSEISARALRFFGVNAVITSAARKDLPRIRIGRLDAYDVPDPLPRASVVPLERAQYLAIDEIHRRLGRPDVELADRLLLPADAARPPAGTADVSPKLVYHRPSSDRMTVSVSSPGPGYLRLLEAWDPGWRATLDGAPAPLIPAYDVFMAVPVPAGSHEVGLAFATPGATTGFAISGAALVLVAGLWWLVRRDMAPV